MSHTKEIKNYLLGYRRRQDKMNELELEISNMIFSDVTEKRKIVRSYHEQIRKLSMECMEIDNALNCLPSAEKAIIQYRYILGASWDDICEKTGYEFEQAVYIHEKALAKIKKP